MQFAGDMTSAAEVHDILIGLPHGQPLLSETYGDLDLPRL